MAKEKTVFFCSECGFEASKWMGQCPNCKSWNTFVEEKTVAKSKNKQVSYGDRPKAVSIGEVAVTEEVRLITGINELDRVLGGGIVKGSLVLVGGDPGIGKSTLLLEMCRNLSDKGTKVFYVSGEESLSQIKMRGDRIGANSKNLMLQSDNDLDNIFASMENCQAEVMIVDSIQTMVSADTDNAPGTVTQVREVTNRLLQLAKRLNVAIFIVGHVTKEGMVAGPRTLEHMVDCVLYFEGDGNAGFRLLRAVKNRFGSTNEIGVFNMTDKGLEEVSNPSKMFLNGRPENAPGSVVVSVVEGSRAIMLEIQALVCDSNFNMARRTAVGVDYNRVNLLMAVLEKRAGLNLAGSDCYVNIAGGMKLNDPSADLGIAMAIASSFRNRALDSSVCIIGEIGLTGEIRGIRNIVQRIGEAEKMGFTSCIIPSSNYDKSSMEKMGIKIYTVSNINEALGLIK
ncbi:DNA repair protein RadA [Eubacterium ruminantium]|uniref:DNA repair protein RadA n=1 Tax=Eubacterium ruminantium TaxID=42322 RepID=UPI001569C64E|nr:DNA repair protein RadA [Eubacterium ruminantium]